MTGLAELGYGELLARAAPFLRAAGATQTGAMIALVPSQADAERLAVPGGEPVDQLHATLVYLGEAAAIPADARARIVERVRAMVDTIALVVDLPLAADGFAISMFNPESDDRQPCIVLGLSGDGLDFVHEAATAAAIDDAYELPEQHAPWVAHVTLVYTDDASRVADLTDRTGPVTFDRLRVAFAGDATDIPLASSLRARAARMLRDLHLRYSDDQERDENGRFAGSGGGGDYGGSSSSSGGGSTPNNLPADKYGNTREDGRWFDGDGGYMTDSYVSQYGKPVTYSHFAHDRGDAYEVVLSERGTYSVGYVKDGGPSDALYTRDSAGVRVSGLSGHDVNSLADTVERGADASTVGRPTDASGEDVGGESFGAGQTFTSSSGIKVTSGANGAVSVGGLGPKGSDLKLSEGEAGEMISSLRSMTEPDVVNQRSRVGRRRRSTFGRSVLHPDPAVRAAVEAATHLPDLPVHLRYSDDQPREANGQFGSTGGGGGSSDAARPGGGKSSGGPGTPDSTPPRPAFRDASNHDELHAAAQAEFHRITGRQINVDMAGSDLEQSKAHLEGIAQGLERFPDAPLIGVHTYGPGATQRMGKTGITQGHETAFAVTNTYGTVENGKFVLKSNIYINNDPGMDISVSRNYLSVPSHTGIGLHEMGHVVTKGSKVAVIKNAHDAAVRMAGSQDPGRFIERSVSRYGASSPTEFAAEAFADVMAHGDKASPVSKAAFDIIESGVTY